MSQYPDSWRKIQQQFAERGGNNFGGGPPKRVIGLGVGLALLGGAFYGVSNALFNGLSPIYLVNQGRGKNVMLGWSELS